MHNNPSIPSSIANGASSNDTTAPNPASTWPRYSTASPYQINLNETGGQTFSLVEIAQVGNTTDIAGLGLRNAFTLVNAYTWEGGRGTRCDFWRSMGVVVPE